MSKSRLFALVTAEFLALWAINEKMFTKDLTRGTKSDNISSNEEEGIES